MAEADNPTRPSPEAPPAQAGGVIALPAGPEASPAEESAPAEPVEESPEAEAARREDDAEPAQPEPEAAEPPEAEVEEVEEPVRETRPGPLALLRLEKVDGADESYRLRPEGEVDTLATSIARLGQLFPVDLRLKPPDRFQIICGFRRVSALRLLKRERVLARVHTGLTDEDALRIALADLIEHQGAAREELEAVQERLESEGRLTPPVRDALERALSPVDEALGPEEVEGEEEEVDLDELAQDITRRLASINQDLALVTELWSAMDPALRRTLLEQLAYPEQLAAYLRSL